MRQDKVVSEVFGEEAILAPSDLYNKQFRRALFGGYQPGEVDAFLERVGDALESLIRQVRALKDQLEQSKSKSEDYQHMEETLRSALVASQRLNETLVDSARREADSIVAAARAEREQLLSRVTSVPAALMEEIVRLKHQRDRLRHELLAILNAHKALLENQPVIEKTPDWKRGITFGSLHIRPETEEVSEEEVFAPPPGLEPLPEDAAGSNRVSESEEEDDT
jgi:DivIVA domain-containing protein